VHKVDIQQGNILDQDMVDKLLPGMTKSQVRFVLGTPLIADTFNQARWDYIYRRVSAAGEKTEENVTVYFDNEDKLDRILATTRQLQYRLKLTHHPVEPID
jgi:outer membrane protein assembly factor BamE